MWKSILVWGMWSAVASVQAATPDVRVRLSTDPTTLDWNRQLDVMSERLSYQLMEGLVSMSDRHEVQPALATSWKLSKDQKTITFKIRPGVTWSDGQPLVAQQFVDSLERLFDPKTGAAGASLLYEVVGAEAMNKGQPLPAEGLGVRAPDAHTLVVTLRRPAKYFLGVFDHPITFPIRKELIQKWGDHWTDPDHLVTLGAYTLKEWTIGKSVKLVRNARYYGKKPTNEEAQFQIIADDLTALNLYEQGQLDLLMGVPMIEFDRLSKREDFVAYPVIANFYIGFNLNKAPFNDLRVRQAFAYATDVRELSETLGGGKRPSTSWIPHGLVGYREGATFPYDPAKAKALLKEAGITGGSPPKITFYLDSREENRTLSERLQAMWSKNLGVRVEIELENWKSLLSHLRSDPPQMFRMGWAMTTTDTYDFMVKFASTNPNNHSQFKNAEYDRLLEQAGAETDPQKRAVLYGKLQTLLLRDETAIIPLFESAVPSLVSPRARALKMNGRTKFMLKEI